MSVSREELDAKRREAEALREKLRQLEIELGRAALESDADAFRHDADLLYSSDVYKSMTLSQEDMIVRVTPDGRFTFVNDAYCEMFGKPRSELLGEKFQPLVHPDDIAGTMDAMKALNEPPHRARLEQRAMTSKGWRWLVWEDIAVVDDDGQIIEIHGLGRDITELRDASASERDPSRHFRDIIENSRDLMWTFDLEAGRFDYISPAFEQIWARPRTERLQSLDTWLEFVHQDDLAHAKQAAAELMAGEKPFSSEYRILRGDGSIRWTHTRGFPIRSGRGEARRIGGIVEDVTERKQAERRLHLLQSVVEQIDESVLVTEASLEWPGPRILYVNPAFEHMSGYKAAEVLGKTPRLLQGPATDRRTLERLKETLRVGETFHGETVNYRKDGSTYDVEWQVKPLRDERGRMLNWVSIQRDITARKRQEELARQHREELAHVTRLSTMGEMASGLAHELNQPLAAITNYVHGSIWRLRDGNMEKEQLEDALQRVGDQAERAGAIIRRLRNFVRRRESNEELCSINELTDEVFALTMAEARKRGVAMEVEKAEDPPSVFADAIQIEQVILNLIRNAMEAMDGMDQPDRRVKIVTRAAPKGGVEVSIEDRGHGMDEEQLARVFDPFYTTKDEGMGIGLTISQSIIEGHGGRIWASSNKPEHPGATFHFWLPTPSEEEEAEETDAADA